MRSRRKLGTILSHLILSSLFIGVHIFIDEGGLTNEYNDSKKAGFVLQLL